MAKMAIVVLADTETHEGLGRVVNTLEAVKDKVVACGLKLAGEYDGHPSFMKLVS